MENKLLSKHQIDQIKKSIDFSKYPGTNILKRKSDWGLDMLNKEALELNMSYGKYQNELYLGRVKRSKEVRYVEAFLFLKDEKLQKEITKIYYS